MVDPAVPATPAAPAAVVNGSKTNGWIRYVAGIILAVSVLIGAISGMITQLRLSRVEDKVDTALVGVQTVQDKVEAVKEEVTTGNAKTMAQLQDAIETRRIEALPPGQRTKEDREHIIDVPDAGKPPVGTDTKKE